MSNLLFCCNQDLEDLKQRIPVLSATSWATAIADRYCCPVCERIWLYAETFRPDSEREVEWCPQPLKTDNEELSALFNDQQTRTKVYAVEEGGPDERMR